MLIDPNDKTEYKCTECGGDAMIAFAPSTIKRGKNKGKQIDRWDGKVKPGERICLPCGRKRGLKFL